MSFAREQALLWALEESGGEMTMGQQALGIVARLANAGAVVFEAREHGRVRVKMTKVGADRLVGRTRPHLNFGRHHLGSRLVG